MSWINTLGFGWLLLGLVPPAILLLYFLKLRRTPVEVPSTFLWKKTIEDLHVNSIWQRLRNNLLLFLQLLAATLIMLAVVRPGCQGQELNGERFIFLIDHSASMSARDLADGTRSRLETAKEEAKNLVDKMKSSDSAMVISFSDRAMVTQSYTKNKALLKKKISEIEQTQRGSDLNEALLAASGLANPGRTSDKNSAIDVQVAEALAATMFILSDGAVKEVPKFTLGNLTPEYRPIGSLEKGVNVGITAFAINEQIEIGEQVQVYARLQNSGSQDANVNLELYVKDELRDAKANVKIPASDSVGLNFDLTELIAGLEEPTPIRLKIENKDVYDQDNQAYCVLNPPRMVNLLVVTDSNQYLELVLKTDRIAKVANVQFESRSFLKEKTYAERASLGFYDLIIFDQCAPETAPACNAVYWASIPKGTEWKTVENLNVTNITDINSSHPLFFSLTMGDVNIVNSQTLAGPQGSEPLISSTRGPVAMIGARGGFEDLVMGFQLVEYLSNNDVVNNTDWPKKLSFPVFVQNLISYLGGVSRFNATRGFRTGETVNIKTQVPFESVTVKDPQGRSTVIKGRQDGVYVYATTENSGVYEVTPVNGKKVEQRFAVNLLDRLESDLTVREELKLGYNQVAGKTESEPARKEYWPWVVGLVLLLVLIEWYIYNQRVLI